MTASRPPRFALHVLRALRVDDESLVGDIVEEFGARRSHLWLWRQVLGAILAGPEARRRTGPLASATPVSRNSSSAQPRAGSPGST